MLYLDGKNAMRLRNSKDDEEDEQEGEGKEDERKDKNTDNDRAIRVALHTEGGK